MYVKILITIIWEHKTISILTLTNGCLYVINRILSFGIHIYTNINSMFILEGFFFYIMSYILIVRLCMRTSVYVHIYLLDFRKSRCGRNHSLCPQNLFSCSSCCYDTESMGLFIAFSSGYASICFSIALWSFAIWGRILLWIYDILVLLRFLHFFIHTR